MAGKWKRIKEINRLKEKVWKKKWRNQSIYSKNEKVKVGKWKWECESEKISVNKAHKTRETKESTQTEMMVSVKWTKKIKKEQSLTLKVNGVKWK